MIYSWLGLRMWVARIAEIPFFKIGEEMSLIGQIQRMASETSWDTPLTEDEFRGVEGVLKGMRAGILKQELHMRRMEHEPRPRVNIVTDAATSIGMAAMWMGTSSESGTSDTTEPYGDTRYMSNSKR